LETVTYFKQYIFILVPHKYGVYSIQFPSHYRYGTAKWILKTLV